MSQEEMQAEWEAAANAVLPPLGSVFESVSGSDGPPMMRLIIMQMVFGALSKAGKLKKMIKVMIIVFISSALMMRDLSNFFKSRGTNIYEQIGLTRQATIYQLEDVFEQYELCKGYDDDCKDIDMTSPIYALNATQVADIKYVVTNPPLKELYDKTETFIRKKGRSKYTPTEG